jgi:chromosome segregation protein
MRLEKLELMGFKSFLERTVLHFEPGITAIVGPNGSGKSNIFDAIRWVLGEQSIKEMRGSKMEDVIFNGTDKYQPLGMAEVSLTFSNEDGRLPIEEKTVTISRRIFRTGESEYLINHNPVRLKDINDLLLGSGIGIDFYSMVGQGKIDLILSSKPEDRRIIFDEASGILKYKLQKKETMRKLEETENNLLRINDIIAEVRRQINSLERQANKAKHYKEVWEQLKEKEKILGILKINKLNKERQEVLNNLNEYTEQEKKLKENYQEELIQNEICQQELKKIEEEIFKIKEEKIHIEHLLEQNQHLKKISQERIEDLTKQKEKLNQDIEVLQVKLTQINKDIEDFNQEYQRLRETLKEKDSLLKEKEERINQITQLKIQSKENIERAKKEIFNLNDLKTKIRNELIDLGAQLKIKESREKRLKIEELKCQQDKDSIQDTFATKRQKKDELKINLEEEIKSVEELKTHIQNLEKEREKLVSQKEFLERLDFAESDSHLKALILTESLPQGDFDGLIVKIKEKGNCTDTDKNIFALANFKLYGEAKTIDFNLERLILKIRQIEEEISCI